LFRNRQTGQITIGQFPNVALWVFLGSVVLRWVVPGRTVVDWIGTGALAWWGLDELIRGVNPWRRFLGAGASIVAATGAVSLLR
jgi:hypothetical protein